MICFKIKEIAQTYCLEEDFIHICIENEWITPLDIEQEVLDQEDLGRLFLIQDLRNTMGVNDEAIPVIMHLLDQIYWLKNKVGLTSVL